MLSVSLAPWPAVRLLVLVATGIVAGSFSSPGIEVWLVLCALSLLQLLGSLLYEQLKHKASLPRTASVIGYALFLFSSFGAYSDFRMHYSPGDGLIQHAGKEVMLYGRVSVVPDQTKKGTGWVMEVEEVVADGRSQDVHDRAKIFMRMAADPGTPICYGDMLRVKGKLDLLPEAANRGEFNPRLTGRMRQLSVQLFTAGPWQVLHEGHPRLNFFESWLVVPVYGYIMKSIADLVPGEAERQLSAGVITGERALLDEELFDAFKITGTAHILAVSGLNVGLLVLLVHVFLQRLKVTRAGRWIALLLVLFILILYSYVTGNSPSVKRAAIMTAVLSGAETLGRKTFALNSLALADLLILLVDPLDLLNPGFIMTNTAVIAILLIYPLLTAQKRGSDGLLRAAWRLLRDAFMVTFAAKGTVKQFFTVFTVLIITHISASANFSTLYRSEPIALDVNTLSINP